MPKRELSSPSQAFQPKSPKTPRVGNPATPPTKVSPRAKHLHVKIDVFSKNGQKVTEDLTTKQLINIWMSLEPDAEIDGCSSHRTANGIRAHFFLKQPVSLSELFPEPEFSHEGTDGVYQCRIVGLNNIRAPQEGETITVCITRTHFGVPLEMVERWIKKFGTVITSPRYHY